MKGQSTVLITAQYELAFTSTLPASQEWSRRYRCHVPLRHELPKSCGEVYAEPIRAAVAALEESLAKKDCAAVRESLQFLQGKEFPMDPVRSLAETSAWAIVSMWVVGVAVEEFPVTASLSSAERWFRGARSPQSLTKLASDDAVLKAESALPSRFLPFPISNRKIQVCP